MPYELHSATIKDTENLFKLLGRKDSTWKKQMLSPDRPNLRYYVLSGSSSPTNVLQLPYITNLLLEESTDLLMIYVQSIAEGSKIFFDIYQFCVSNSLIEYPTRSVTPEKKFAFLHSNLGEDVKKKIISDAQKLRIKILIATSSAGAGIHLPITTFVGWGLDREPSGIVQASGRTARGSGDGNVVWIHNPSLHGKRVPSKSAIRELLQGKCLRACQNGWFFSDQVLEQKPDPQNCCSVCMEKCIKEGDCVACSAFLDKFKHKCEDFVKSPSAVEVFSDYLKSLKISERSPKDSPTYDEFSLAKTIMKSLYESKDMMETIDFLEIFSLGVELNQEIAEFLKKNSMNLFTKPLQEEEDLESSSNSSNSESSSGTDTDDSEEYFDDEK